MDCENETKPVHGTYEKELFKTVVKSELAGGKPVLCHFALKFIDKHIPDYFWIEAASSSGRHHPEFSLGEGGLARHSLMTYRWLKSLLDANEQDMSEYVPGMVVGCLFHDCCKRGIPPDIDLEHTKFEHPLLAAKYVLDKANEFIKDEKQFIDTTADDEQSFLADIAVVASTIQCHMGRFNKSTHSEFVLPKPTTPIEYMVHLADYCASRKFTKFDVDFFNGL